MTEKTLENQGLSGPLPEVEARGFAINYLSMSPEGFLLVTDNLVPKTEDLHLDDQEKAVLGEGMKREMQFNGVDALRRARASWRANPTDETLENAFYDERAAYQNKGKKIGLRNIRVEDGVIHTDAQLVHFPSYTLFGQPDQREGIERISRLVGTSMIVRTSDNRLIIQHRAIEKQHLQEAKPSRGNAVYSDIPGASVAGMFDASLKSAGRQSGTPDAITTDDVYASIYKEGSEELGLASTDFSSVRIVGVAEDKIKVHDELLLLADTSMTAAEIEEASRTSNRNKNLGDADFEEKFVDIEATPDAIARLLTEVKCPPPPTHAAALTAAGFAIALEQHGTEYALAWRDQVEQGLRDNYAAIDALVREYYDKFPEELERVPERYWNRSVPPRNPDGYEPAYGPTEQGLPRFEDEMVRTGLIAESRTAVRRAHLLDVDRLLSSSIEDTAGKEELVEHIVQQLKVGEPVLVDSARSIEEIDAQVVAPIRELVGQDLDILTRFVVVGEKGGTWLTFDQGGKAVTGRVESLVMPLALQQALAELIADEYPDIVVGSDQRTTVTSLDLVHPNASQAYDAPRRQLVEDIRAMLRDAGLDATYVVNETGDMVTVESPYVGKHVAADRFLQHLADLDIKPGYFDVRGDQQPDTQTADELMRRGYVVPKV